LPKFRLNFAQIQPILLLEDAVASPAPTALLSVLEKCSITGVTVIFKSAQHKIEQLNITQTVSP